MVFLYLVEEALAIFLSAINLIFMVDPLTQQLALSKFRILKILCCLTLLQVFYRVVNIEYSDKEYQHLNENHA